MIGLIDKRGCRSPWPTPLRAVWRGLIACKKPHPPSSSSDFGTHNWPITISGGTSSCSKRKPNKSHLPIKHAYIVLHLSRHQSMPLGDFSLQGFIMLVQKQWQRMLGRMPGEGRGFYLLVKQIFLIL